MPRFSMGVASDVVGHFQESKPTVPSADDGGDIAGADRVA
jgi:hypothetical protein